MLTSHITLCLAAALGASAVPHLEQKRDYAACVTAVSKAPRRQANSDCASFRYYTTSPCVITGLCAAPTLLPSQSSTCDTGAFQPTDIPAYASCGDADSYASACANIGIVAQTSYRPQQYCINGPTTTIVQSVPQTVVQTAVQTIVQTSVQTVTVSPPVPQPSSAANAWCMTTPAWGMSFISSFESVYAKSGFRGDTSKYNCGWVAGADSTIIPPYASDGACKAIQACSISLRGSNSKSFTVHQALDSNLWTCIGYKGIAGATIAWTADSNIGLSFGYRIPPNINSCS